MRAGRRSPRTSEAYPGLFNLNTCRQQHGGEGAAPQWVGPFFADPEILVLLFESLNALPAFEPFPP